MKASSKFDFIIVGGGLSGLHLSYCFLNDKYFNDYSFLIIDTSRVFFERLRLGENPFLADKIHFHYLLYQKSKSHNITLLVIFMLNIIACIISTYATLFDSVSFNFAALYLALTIIFIFSTKFVTELINKIKFPKIKIEPNEQLPVLQDTIFRIYYLSYALMLYFLILFFSKYNQILALPNYQSAALVFIVISIFLLINQDFPNNI